ncbi:MAG: MMPL family transporter, partial [Clostridia bacterium]
MDYALFLLHQYRTELTKTLDAKEALSKAIPKSAKAVAASALTTVGGFLALLCMKFGVGSDLGLSLAKGILCSLLTVLFLQPCLMLMFEKARVKTQHKCIDLHFKTPVKHSIKNRWPIAIAFVLLLVPMFLASNSLKYNYVKFLPPSTDVSTKSLMAQELGNQVMMILPYKGEINGFKVDLFNQNYKFVDKLKEMKEDGKISFSLGLFSMVPKDATLDKSAISKSISDAIAVESDEALKNQMQNMLDLLSGAAVPDKIPFTLALSMFNTMPKDVLDAMGMGAITSYLTDDGFTMYTVGINPKYDSESQESFNILADLKPSEYQIFKGVDDMKFYITGSNQGAYDFAKITPNDFMLVSLVSILAILVILIFTLGGIKFPILLVILIEFGIWINLAMQYIFAGGAVNFMAYLIITAVQLGATVDYAILVSTKYRDLRKRLEPRAAAYTATTTSAMTILTSALIMAGACFSVFF